MAGRLADCPCSLRGRPVVVAVLLPLAFLMSACSMTPTTQPTSPTTTAPSFTKPTVAAIPSTALTTGEKVRVQVTGFDIGGKVWLSECASAADANQYGCGLQLAEQPFFLTEDDRTGSTTFAVSNTASTKPYDTTDMVTCSAQCVLVAAGGAGGGFAYASLSFSPPTATTTTTLYGGGWSTCDSTHLQARQGLGGSVASQPFVIIAVTNAGPVCRVNGYPGIASVVGHETDPVAGASKPLPIDLHDGSVYERNDPGPTPVFLTTGGSVSFALGTETATGPLYTVTYLSITMPGSSTPLSVGGAGIACSGMPAPVYVTAFVGGATGPSDG